MPSQFFDNSCCEGPTRDAHRCRGLFSTIKFRIRELIISMGRPNILVDSMNQHDPDVVVVEAPVLLSVNKRLLFLSTFSSNHR